TMARTARLAVAVLQPDPFADKPPVILPDAPVATGPVTAPEKSPVVPDAFAAGPKEKLETDSHPVVDEATANKLLIESIQSLLGASPVQNPRFFTYSVDKKDLEGFKSDMTVLRVVYEERVFFDTDKADVRSEALPVVKSVANTLKQQKQKIALF